MLEGFTVERQDSSVVMRVGYWEDKHGKAGAPLLLERATSQHTSRASGDRWCCGGHSARASAAD